KWSGIGVYGGGLMVDRFHRAFASDGAVEVTLRAPIPLERRLAVTRADEALMLHDGEQLICEARAGRVDHLKPPPPPTDWNDVMRRGEAGGAPEDSEFAGCIVCRRPPAVGDGLRVLGAAGPPPGSAPPCLHPPKKHAAH